MSIAEKAILLLMALTVAFVAGGEVGTDWERERCAAKTTANLVGSPSEAQTGEFMYWISGHGPDPMRGVVEYETESARALRLEAEMRARVKAGESPESVYGIEARAGER